MVLMLTGLHRPAHAAMLCDAVRAAAAAVRIARPYGTGTAVTLSFGAPPGTDVRNTIRRDDQRALHVTTGPDTAGSQPVRGRFHPSD